MEGLARFDGPGFYTLNTRNTPKLRINYILGLFVDRDSVLWVAWRGARCRQLPVQTSGIHDAYPLAPPLDHRRGM